MKNPANSSVVDRTNPLPNSEIGNQLHATLKPWLCDSKFMAQCVRRAWIRFSACWTSERDNVDDQGLWQGLQATGVIVAWRQDLQQSASRCLDNQNRDFGSIMPQLLKEPQTA